MKKVIIALALLGVYSQAASAASYRCSDEKKIIAIFHDNGFNPAGEAITHASLYEIKPMETVLLDTLPCIRTRSPADGWLVYCGVPQSPGKARPYSATLEEEGSFSIVRHKSPQGIKSAKVNCKPL